MKLLDSPYNISVHCKTGDYGFSFIITIESSPLFDNLNKDKSPSILPHAHIYIKDKQYKSRFLLTNETIPKTLEELQTVDETDMPLDIIGEDLIKWLNSKPIRSYSKIDKTNWDAMKTSWFDNQEVIKDLLKEK